MGASNLVGIYGDWIVLRCAPMMQIPKIEEVHLLPEYRWSAHVQMEFHTDSWDGPLTGLALLNGHPVWFAMHDETRDDAGWARQFLLIQLTPEQVAEERYWHAEFETYVKDAQGMKPAEEHGKFYSRYQQRAPVIIQSEQIIGRTTQTGKYFEGPIDK